MNKILPVLLLALSVFLLINTSITFFKSTNDSPNKQTSKLELSKQAECAEMHAKFSRLFPVCLLALGGFLFFVWVAGFFLEPIVSASKKVGDPNAPMTYRVKSHKFWPRDERYMPTPWQRWRYWFGFERKGFKINIRMLYQRGARKVLCNWFADTFGSEAFPEDVKTQLSCLRKSEINACDREYLGWWFEKEGLISEVLSKKGEQK